MSVVDYNFWSKFGVLKPKSLMINLTYRCNSKCVMCNIWKIHPKKELDYKGWQKVLEDPLFKGIEQLTVSGGEIYLNGQVDRLVKLFVDKMPRVRRLVLNTNGFLPDVVMLKTKIIADYCQKKGVKLAVSVSVDGVDLVHDNIRRINGGFAKVKRTIVGLKELAGKYNFSLGVGSLLMGLNIDKFDEVKKWLGENELAYGFQIVGFHNTFVNNLETEKELGFDKNTDKQLRRVLGELQKDNRWKNILGYYWRDLEAMYFDKKGRTTPCPFLRDQLVIDGLGDVYYCLSVPPIGNMFDGKKTVGQIYYDKRNLELRRQLPRKECWKCNSGCDVHRALRSDLKRYVWYRFTGRLWPLSLSS